ncbi:hypothetical protein QFC21_004998 [Naganishia friedmannii]|uniref:Uncharacterized protein n=1 Tax=Naganishia friedmannii TaxID=89922 RepID=A0ACC2VBI5_9TREE|nr:hypothetical protein QFC21_004998 [Naganishia friedmannii]
MASRHQVIAQLATRARPAARCLHTSIVHRNVQQLKAVAKSDDAEPEELTGSAKLLAEALEEEAEEARSFKTRKGYRRTDRLADDSPIWTGEENTRDAVLRMLMDSHKPLRSDVVATAEQKIKDLTRRLDMEPIIRDNSAIAKQERALKENLEDIEGVEERNLKRLSRSIQLEQQIPPEQFRPWMAQYIAKDEDTSTPSIFHGKFLNTGPSSSSSLLDRPVISNDPKIRNAERQRKRTERAQGRIIGAREGALDYRLGGGEGYQTRGTSAAGGGVKGGPSGMRAWQNLVEDRIERARSKGWFDNVSGRGKRINHDHDENNPYLDRGEYFMNRIVKRQGAKPPWIELLGAFRTSILSSYVRSLVRSLITSPFHSRQSLAQLSLEQVEAMRDKRWLARDGAYHAEAVKDLNNTVRKMNAMAPQVARRGLVVLDDELALVYRSAAPLVLAEIAKRSSEDWDKIRELEMQTEETVSKKGSRLGGMTDGVSKDAEMFKWQDLGVMEAIRSLFRRSTQ